MFTPRSSGPMQIQPMRVIVLAMAMGILTFLVISVVLRSTGALADAGRTGGVLLLVLGVFTASAVGGLIVVRQMMISRARQTLGTAHEPAEPDQLTQAYLMMTLISAAIVEGASLFGVVTYMLEGDWYALVVPGVGLIALLGVLFPTESRRAAFTRAVDAGRMR
jgi:hypothetical protein